MDFQFEGKHHFIFSYLHRHHFLNKKHQHKSNISRYVFIKKEKFKQKTRLKEKVK